jgi:hypothetical protein
MCEFIWLLFNFCRITIGMMHRLLTTFILASLLQSVWACLPPPYDENEERPEPQIEVVLGVGGSCYYKRIPKKDESLNQVFWSTEFYLSTDDETPTFVANTDFYSPIACVQDELGQSHISSVIIDYPWSIDDKSWLEFWLDNEVITSYAPIDIIKRPENVQHSPDPCAPGPLYLQSSGFVKSQGTNQYIYQIQTFDNRFTKFNLLTGQQLPAE